MSTSFATFAFLPTKKGVHKNKRFYPVIFWYLVQFHLRLSIHTAMRRAPGAREDRRTGRSSQPRGPRTGDPHRCPHCARLFTDIRGLRGHCDLAHSGALFVCPHCTSTFGDGEALRAHCLSVHGGALGHRDDDDDEPPGGGAEERDPPARRCQAPFWDWSPEYKAAALAVPEGAAFGELCSRAPATTTGYNRPKPGRCLCDAQVHFKRL